MPGHQSYVSDPAGNFSEYYSDIDIIVDDQLWEPRVFDRAEIAHLNGWGPAHSRSFMQPEDIFTDELIARMTDAHHPN